MELPKLQPPLAEVWLGGSRDGSIACWQRMRECGLVAVGMKDPNRLAIGQRTARRFLLVRKATFMIGRYINCLSMCLAARLGELD